MGEKGNGMKKIIIRSLILIGITLCMIITGLYCIMWICVNGPSERARELFVLSVRETSAVGFLADIFCKDEEIAMIEAKQTDEENTITDTSLITVETDKKTVVQQESSVENTVGSEEQNSAKTMEENDTGDVAEEPIEFHEVSGATYKGIMMIVKDPSRVIVGTSAPVYAEGTPGKKVADMIASYGGIGGVNAGGFEDPQGAGDGGIPKGVVISEGTLRFGNPESTYEIIGINQENVLVVGSMTTSQAMEMGIRDAVSFGPVLVVNGEATRASQGGGLNPRTAIGQRKDGAILLLVIDGRQSSSLGASYSDITEIMLDFGAVNAANLDGGSSSVMYYEGELLNSCSSLYGPREMPTCIVVR